MLRLTLCAAALLLPLSTVRAQTSTDDFAAYPDGSDGAPAWRATGLGWAVDSGAMRAERASGFLLNESAGYGRRLTLEATVTLDAPTAGDGWLTAGLRLYQDAANSWGLNFVVSPAEAGGQRFVELHEMLRGQWLAEGQPGGAAQLLDQWTQPGWQWEDGRPHRIGMAYTGDAVTATISELDGAQRARWTYRLLEGAVDRGWAGLACSGLDATFDDVTVVLDEPAPAPVAKPREAYPPFAGGATGFYRVETRDGRWWVVDPAGQPDYMVGTDHANYTVHWCQKLGYAPYNRNCEARYGSADVWAESTAGRLQSWNFNLLGANSSPEVRYRGLPHTLFAAFGSGFAPREWIAKPIHWTGFPDVFSPRFESWCRLVARELTAECVEDPWLFGYFLDNELEWFGKTGNLADDAFLLPADQPAKQALIALLEERYQTVERANAALGTLWASFRDAARETVPPTGSKAWGEVRAAYLARAAERYFAISCTALRAADPNHMILGCRFAGVAPKEVLEAAGRWVDIFTINTYPRVDMAGRRVLGTPEMLVELHEATGRPMMITEWSFPALDSGLPCKGGAGMRVDTQEQKALCYDIFATMIARLPFMVGYDYFMWVDEPKEAISDTFPEDSNYGLVDVNDDPWELFTQRATEVNATVEAVHAEAPLDTSWVSEEPAAPAIEITPEQLEAKGAIRSDDLALAWDLGGFQLAREATSGDVLSSLAAGSLHLGHFAGLVQQSNAGGNAWPRTTQPVRVSSWETGDEYLADITVACSESSASTVPYEITWRLYARKGWPCAVAQVQSIHNAGGAPLSLEAWFAYVLPSIGGSPEGDGVGGPNGVPNYYLDSSCWADPVAGGWLGVSPLTPGTVDANFWTGPSNEGSFHADCRRKVAVVLAPGETWTGEAEPWIAIYGFGPDQPDGWKRMADSDAPWRTELLGR